jgi:hypothetical protein
MDLLLKTLNILESIMVIVSEIDPGQKIMIESDLEDLDKIRQQIVSRSDDKTSNIAVVMPSFLNELAEKHNVDVNKLVVGMQFGDIQVWRYDTGAYEVWKTLEIIPKN